MLDSINDMLSVPNLLPMATPSEEGERARIRFMLRGLAHSEFLNAFS